MTFPATRMRRMRAHAFSRRLMRENILTPDDLIWPVFVLEGDDATEEVSSLPGVERMTIDRLLPAAEHCMELGIPAIALFPVVGADCKSDDARALDRSDPSNTRADLNALAADADRKLGRSADEFQSLKALADREPGSRGEVLELEHRIRDLHEALNKAPADQSQIEAPPGAGSVAG